MIEMPISFDQLPDRLVDEIIKESKMRSIYLKNPRMSVECPSCGGPKVIYPVGFTMGDKNTLSIPVYGCKSDWHTRGLRQSEI